MTETKRCTKCGRELPLSEFYRDDAHSDGRHSCCRGCIKKTRREAFLRNVELSRALKKADETLGGWKAYGLKHPKPGEYKYNIVFTDGRLSGRMILKFSGDIYWNYKERAMEEYVNKEELKRRGFQRGDDGIYRKLTALERCEDAGWLDWGDSRFSASDRKSVGERFAADYFRSRVGSVSALNPEKIRVDGNGKQITPEYVAAAENRYRKALKLIPAGCRGIVRRVCIDDCDFSLKKGLTCYERNKERVHQATLLCLGLDELGKFYAGLRENNG